MNNDRKALRREALWVLANIVAGSIRHIEAFLEFPGLFETLIDLL
jgi:hypothetical protein